jgi:hypothetical protein
MHIEFWWENQIERDHYEDLDIGGRVILKLILDRIGWYGLDLSGPRQGSCSCEHGNENLGSIKFWEFFFRNYITGGFSRTAQPHEVIYVSKDSTSTASHFSKNKL